LSRAEGFENGLGFSPCARRKAQRLKPLVTDALWHG